MKKALLEILCCPQSGQRLELETNETSEINEGWLISADKRYRYPIRNGIPRFVPETNYADNFGMQWNLFARTQLDSYTGHPISSDRYWNATGWNSFEMRDKWVLDIGCGSGRFAEVALSSGAQVIALDYSSAVDACWSNLKHHPNLHVVQGDVYALPFCKNSFDFVYSLGVLQHTPDVEKAFGQLPPMLKKGGYLCVDFYEKSFRSLMLPYYWLRPITKRMDQKKLFKIVKNVAPKLLPISIALNKIPLIGKYLKRLVPVACYKGMLPLSDAQLQEWAILDTFDWLAPAYDNPQTASAVEQFFKQNAMEGIEVLKAGHLVGRGYKK